MAKRLTSDTISEIKHLRTQGWTLTELKRHFKIGYGSVYRHIKGASILPEYLGIWKDKRKSSVGRMKKAESEAAEKASKAIKKLSLKEKLLILASIYWAEGTKVDLSLTNSDPRMINLFIVGVTKILGVPKDRLKNVIGLLFYLILNTTYKLFLKLS